MKSIILTIFFIIAAGSALWGQPAAKPELEAEKAARPASLTENELKAFCDNYKTIYQLMTEEDRIKVLGFGDERMSHIYQLCYKFSALENGGSQDELGLKDEDITILRKYKSCVLLVGGSS